MEMIFTQDSTIKKMFIIEEDFKQRKGVWVLQRQGDKKLSMSLVRVMKKNGDGLF